MVEAYELSGGVITSVGSDTTGKITDFVVEKYVGRKCRKNKLFFYVRSEKIETEQEYFKARKKLASYSKINEVRNGKIES